MKEIITIINQKGGVGKSTTANAIGAWLSLQGQKVLYIDMDAQGNLSYSLKASNKYLSTMEVLRGTATAEDAICHTMQGDIIPANNSIALAESYLKDTGKEYRLKECLQPIIDRYDYIIIDTPPALNVVTINALTASDSVIIPVQADIYSMQGVTLLKETIDTVRKYCNPQLEIKGILITRYSNRNNLTKEIIELMEQQATALDAKIFKTRIRECIALKESQANCIDIFTYAPRSNATIDYENLMKEITAR